MKTKKSKKNEESVDTIAAGVPMTVTGSSRTEIVNKLRELRQQASEQGLTSVIGGFVQFCQGSFKAVITFNK